MKVNFLRVLALGLVVSAVSACSHDEPVSTTTSTTTRSTAVEPAVTPVTAGTSTTTTVIGGGR